MHRIYQFSEKSGEGEFIVISDEPAREVLVEHQRDGIELDYLYTIKEDGDSLPCDRALVVYKGD